VPSPAAVGDFNGDGIPDLAVVPGGFPLDIVSVLLGNGDGTFQAARNFATGAYSVSVAVGDFNRDGVPDLAVVNFTSSSVSVLLGNGDGTFQAARNFATGTTRPFSVALGDFNGEGVPELVVGGGDDVETASISVVL